MLLSQNNLATYPQDLTSSPRLLDNILVILSALVFIIDISLLLDYFHQLKVKKSSQLKIKSKSPSQLHMYDMLPHHVSIILTFNLKELSTCCINPSLFSWIHSGGSPKFHPSFFVQDHLWSLYVLNPRINSQATFYSHLTWTMTLS